MLLKLLIILAVVFVYKFISAIADLINIYRYKKMYENFLNQKGVETLLEHKSFILKLFKKANIQDSHFPVSQPVGFGQVANFTASTFDTFPSRINIFVPETMSCFHEAIGVFRNKIFECFNPLYWIRSIIFLPRTILIYLNVSAESIFIKICQVIYWLIGIIVTLFTNEIASWLKSFIHFQ